MNRLLTLAALGLLVAVQVAAQNVPTAVIRGTVRDSETGAQLPGALVELEGQAARTVTDSTGAYVIRSLTGPQILRVSLLGYASARVPLALREGELLERSVFLSVRALQMEELVVTADAVGRAAGETGTATVIERAAIDAQPAVSIAGLLELVPGTILSPPGLSGVQQFALRAIPVPASAPGSAIVPERSSTDIASFGTSIILDGIPLSNNANLQTLGPRGELTFPSSAGGGIDLRRIPASTIDRVEVIRGVPSVRYGDLTQGAIILYTRADVVDPELSVQLDPNTGATTGLAGFKAGGRQVFTASVDAARTRIDPGVRGDAGWRIAGQVMHRFQRINAAVVPSFVSDTRLDFFQVLEDQPLDTLLTGQLARYSRDRGLRVSNRSELSLRHDLSLSFAAAIAATRQESSSQRTLTRPAMPFTSRLTEGTQEGHYVVGSYVARVNLDGTPWHLFGRGELDWTTNGFGLDHDLRFGGEVRREWNGGAGVVFDVETPPQTTFNAINGYDRPRRYDSVSPLVASTLYLDDRASVAVGRRLVVIQAGLRADMVHDGSSWLSSIRDVAIQPRINAHLALFDNVRFRLGAGRTVKLPTLSDLSPAPQYFDIVNVNYFANDPRDRLALLTTLVHDTENPELAMTRADKFEAGVDLFLAPGSVISLVVFSDRVRGAVGTDYRPSYIIREHFDVSDVPGDGIRPVVLPGPASLDTVPILIQRPANNSYLASRGIELTAVLPEITPLKTRLEAQAVWISSELLRVGNDYGPADLFTQFQLLPSRTRSPYWEPAVRKAERAVMTYRAVYHEAPLGLAVTTTLQHYILDRTSIDAATDTLAFAGYVTRAGRLAEVPATERADDAYGDLRRSRTGLLSVTEDQQPDWIVSLQVSKTLPGDGQLSFYAFNAFDREGRAADQKYAARVFPGARFGVDVRMPLGNIW